MTDTELTEEIKGLRIQVAGHERDLESKKQLIASIKAQIKVFEKEQQRRQAWAEKNRLPSAG